MYPEIPYIVELLYTYLVTTPNPDHLPEGYQKDPVKGQGLWAFYQGVRLGLQISDACMEKL